MRRGEFVEKKGIYGGESVKGSPPPPARPTDEVNAETTATITINPTPEPLLYFDLDDEELTLMDTIKAIRHLSREIPEDQTITLYFVQGNRHKSGAYVFPFKFLHDYLISTGMRFDVVFRGYVPSRLRSSFPITDNIRVLICKGFIPDGFQAGMADFNNYNYEEI